MSLPQSRGLSLLLAALPLLLAACSGPATPPPKTAAEARPDEGTMRPATAAATAGTPLSVQVFLMSKCPYAVQAMATLDKLNQELDGRLDLQLDYIVEERDGQMNSLHGEAEVKGNIQQLCAMATYPDQARWLSFIACQNRSWRQIPEGWEACAEEAGMEPETLRLCVEGETGKELLRKSMARTWAARALASPTVVIGGAPHAGRHDHDSLLRALCRQFTDARPKACAALPEEPELTVTVLSDRRCGVACNVDRLLAILKTVYFPGLKVRRVDYSEPQGKALYGSLGLSRLPALLFDKAVTRSQEHPRLARWLSPRGDYLQLRGPAPFDPTAEICDNGRDDTGNGKVDCDDSGCADKRVCRKLVPNQLDVFVMSMCPYGVKGLDAVREVLALFGKQITFKVHYIATRTESGFAALHGQPEVAENIRQLCAAKLYRRGGRYLDYVWCRNRNIRSSDWQTCAKGGVDAGRLARCAEGPEGKALLAEDIKLAQTLEISASPTWMANNRYTFHGIDAETIRAQLCRHNPGLKGCDKTLSTSAPGGSGGACGN